MDFKDIYPPARRDDVVEDYHGTPVADPYRWMEDPSDDDVKAWGEAQAKLAFDYLEELPMRPQLREGLQKLYDRERYNAPFERGEWYYFFHNNGLQNQAVLYRSKSLDGEHEQVLDPNQFSEDGTVALGNWSITKDGTLLAYSTTDGGTDWQTIHILDVDKGEHFEEKLKWCRFTGMTWDAGNEGFYYSRYPETDDLEDSKSTFNQKLYYHKLDTPQSDDVLMYERPDAPELGFFPTITDDKKYLVLSVWQGAINRNRIYYRLLDSDDDFVRLLDDADAEYNFIGSVGDDFLIATDNNAPMKRVIAIDVNKPDKSNWRTIIPEGDDPINNIVITNEQLVVHKMHNAHSTLSIYTLDGEHIRDVALPTLGTVQAAYGERSSSQMFIEFTSFLYPASAFKYDFNSDELTPIFTTDDSFDASEYETTQVFYPSKDGTQVSMFITHKKGIELDSSHPTLLYGYGGYSIPLTPAFAPHIINWLQHGGVYAVANLRGGSEYGEAWHQGGMLHTKQNTFDDFIAAAEWLGENGYAGKGKVAIMGRSNGGLLVAACMTQRPDLFGAVICNVPVTDMLRFHRFTAGRFWTPEYGNAEENSEHFEFLYKYSPIHNVKAGEQYPPTLVLSADLDDRVVPMHAKKFAAELQWHQGGDAPILLRLDTRSGHGHGKPVSKWIDEWADIQAFLMQYIAQEL